MSWYGRRAGSKLRDALAELSKEQRELHSLEEEMLAARLVADHSLELFEQACMSGKEVQPDTRALAMGCAREALSHVASIVEKSAKVRAVSAALIGPEDVKLIADSMIIEVRKALEAAGVDLAVVERVERAIADMPLPQREARGQPAVTVTVS